MNSADFVTGETDVQPNHQRLPAGFTSFRFPDASCWSPSQLPPCATSRIIRKMQSKTMMTSHLTLVCMAITKKKRNKHIGEDVEKREHLSTIGRIVNWESKVQLKSGTSMWEWLKSGTLIIPILMKMFRTKNSHTFVAGNPKWYSHFWKLFVSFLRN